MNVNPATTSSLLVCLIGLFIDTCQGQAWQKADTSRPFYVGLQTASNWYEILYRSGTPGQAKITTPLLSAGFYLKPRLAVQISYGYVHDVSKDPGGTGTTSAGQIIIRNRHSQETWQQAIPVTLRYTLSRSPQTRLQADAIAGLVVVTSRFNFHMEDLLDGQVTFEERRSNQATQVFATAGIGARFRIKRQLEATGDLSWNRNLNWAPAYVHQQVTGNKWGITRSLNLGLRYRFRLGQQKAAE